jgi:uncharacterized protein YbjT (DUF2867 family)
MYAITGATGNTGHIIAETLLQAGKKVRVLGRDAAKLKALADKGAELAIGNVEDPAFLAKAFNGVTAAYVLIPPNLQAPDILAYQAKIGEAQARALREANVKYVVHLSSIGAHTPVGTGPVAGLFYQERRLNKLPNTHVLHLRPGYFMENVLGSIGMIKGMGINGSPIRADVKMGFTATRDIGNYAAKRLLALDFTGKEVQELIGARDMTPQEFTSILGAAVGKTDLKWVQFPAADALHAMQGMGLSASMAQSFVDLSKFISEGGGNVIFRDAENTTPTSGEQFANEVFAPAYNAG